MSHEQQRLAKRCEDALADWCATDSVGRALLIDVLHFLSIQPLHSDTPTEPACGREGCPGCVRCNHPVTPTGLTRYRQLLERAKREVFAECSLADEMIDALEDAATRAADLRYTPHFCQDGHDPIHHVDGENETCPLCATLALATSTARERDELKKAVKEWTDAMDEMRQRCVSGEDFDASERRIISAEARLRACLTGAKT